MSVVGAFFDVARKIDVPWIERGHETSIDGRNAPLFRAQRPGGRRDRSRKYKEILHENALAADATCRNGPRPERHNAFIEIWHKEAARTRIRLGPDLGHCSYSQIAIDESSKTRDFKVVATLDPSDPFGSR